MSIWLVMQANDGVERRFAVKEKTVIGRETTCDVRVPVPTVSQRHCQLNLDGDQLRLTDLRSERGTFHNGNRVEQALLSHSDKLTIGPVTFIIHIERDLNGNGPAPEIVIERIEQAEHHLNGDAT